MAKVQYDSPSAKSQVNNEIYGKSLLREATLSKYCSCINLANTSSILNTDTYEELWHSGLGQAKRYDVSLSNWMNL